MAIYHLAAKIISRSAGRSAVACAAYRAAELLHDDRQGMTHDYTRKRGVEFAGIFAPQDAPDWTQDRAALWNAIEAAEKRKDAQLARELELALPHELDALQRRYLIQDFIKENFTRKGFLCDVAIHEPDREGDRRNYHAHVLTTFRTVDENGFSKNKDRSQNATAALEHWRERWAEHGARHLARAGHETEAERFRHGYKTLEQQRAAALERGDLEHAEALDREATQKMGEAATQLERRGVQTDRGDGNRAIEARNAERAALREAMRDAAAEIEHQPEAPRPMTPEDHAAALARRGDDAAARWLERMQRPTPDQEPAKLNALRWLDTTPPPIDIREGFAAAKDGITARAQDHEQNPRQEGGQDEGLRLRPAAQSAGDYLALCRNPLSGLRLWLDEDRRGRGEGVFLPSRPRAGMADDDGLRPPRGEEAPHDTAPARVDHQERDLARWIAKINRAAVLRNDFDATREEATERRPQDAPEATRSAPETRQGHDTRATDDQATRDAEAKAQEARTERIRKLFEEAERRKIEREIERQKNKGKTRSKDF